MALVADHSTGGAIIGGTLKRDGYHGVVRYASEGRGNVNLTPAEVRDLEANGLKIAVVCEHESDWLLHTLTVAGRVAASRNIARACGLPDGVIWCACDFDATLGGPTSPGSLGDRNMRAVLDSLDAAAGVIGRANVGFYGSKYAIDWLEAHAPWVQWYWQTEAWSRGQLSPRACLFQRARGATVAGVQVDVNDVLKPGWGARIKPPPPPTPTGPHGVARAVVEVDISTNEMTIHPLPGVVHWGPAPEWISKEVQLGRGGEIRGRWRHAPLRYDAPPLGS